MCMQNVWCREVPGEPGTYWNLPGMRSRLLLPTRLHALLLLAFAAGSGAALQLPFLSSPAVRSAASSASRTIVDKTEPARELLGDLPWVLAYADLRPYDEKSPESAAFLATNLAYFGLGGALLLNGASASSPAFGLLIDLAGVASVGYHYAQCAVGGTRHPTVQAFLLLDYAFAIPSLLIGASWAAELGDAVPASATICFALAGAALAAGWVWEKPRQYMLTHGAWHVFGAAGGYELAVAHGQLIGDTASVPGWG